RPENVVPDVPVGIKAVPDVEEELGVGGNAGGAQAELAGDLGVGLAAEDPGLQFRPPQGGGGGMEVIRFGDQRETPFQPLAVGRGAAVMQATKVGPSIFREWIVRGRPRCAPPLDQTTTVEETIVRWPERIVRAEQ